MNRTPGATTVVLDAQGLSNVGSTQAVIGMRRWRDYPLAAGTSAGGKIAMTYQTGELPLELE